MQAIRQLLDRCLVAICVFIFMMMTVVGTYQIVTRYFFNSPSTISEEIITYSFTWLSLLSATYVFGMRGHLCMTFFYGKFTGKKRVLLDVFSELLIVIFAVLLLLNGGMEMASQNWDQDTASLGISMGLMYSILPLSGVFICIYGVMNLLDLFRICSSPDVESYGVAKAAE
ncbi:MAG: TRAP transporter small permease [Succinivibrionaceae bacterium]|nr:TRAP transporter small permease [Succinivibrionaceae bacterium]